ncbi:hypothetical protein BDA96_10G022200 [Sorghum bicolor]|uniref:Uncharacterized protein n=2 Tax=Sorghum bicolor TaxID=4558 RepID=A0A921TXX8_SORBI|nr:hypothetical protein BDA96_10G022200 [Sorghum bicolor]KAG0512533.1 hypothetical protein BDA96_10G022200 [Sorghum bicolor]KXG19186.1 hypothetical protein SORBI_3010G019200 [Sorghum bicolor]
MHAVIFGYMHALCTHVRRRPAKGELPCDCLQLPFTQTRSIDRPANASSSIMLGVRSRQTKGIHPALLESTHPSGYSGFQFTRSKESRRVLLLCFQPNQATACRPGQGQLPSGGLNRIKAGQRTGRSASPE